MTDQPSWLSLGARARACVQDEQIIAVAYWDPADDSHQASAGPRFTYYVTSVYSPVDRVGFSDGPEPTSHEWPVELLEQAYRAYLRHWGGPVV